MKGVRNFLKKSMNKIISSLLAFAVTCVGIGYAKIATNLNIEGNVAVAKTSGIFIVDASYKTGANTLASNNKILSYDYSILNGKTALTNTSDKLYSSYTIFAVSFYNNTDMPYKLKEIVKLDGYSNLQIDCEASYPNGDDVIQPGDYLTIDITFRYVDNVDTTVPNFRYLDFSISFNFNIVVTPNLANDMVPVTWDEEAQSWKTTEEDSFDYSDYESGVWANAVTYDHTKIHSDNEYTVNAGTFFDGAAYYINYRHENYDFNHNITVGARFKWDGTGSNSLGYIVCNLESAGFGLFVTHHDTTVGGKSATAGQIGFCYIVENGTEYFTLSNTIVPMFTWATVIATYDGTTVKLYIDGVLDKTEAHTGDIKPSEASVNVGRNPKLDNTGTFFFDGNISHVMLLNDTLTDNECKQAYDTRFNIPTADRNEIFNLDITSRDVNGKYFDGKTDGGYNLGLASESFVQGDVTKMSIAVRFNVFAFTSENVSYLAASHYSVGGYGIGIRRDDNSDKATLYFSYRNASNSGFINLKGHELFDLKTWHTAVVTCDGYNIHMYLDGREQILETADNGFSYTAGKAIRFVNSPAKLILGGRPNNSSVIYKNWYNGWIREIAVFKKTLSQSEINRDFTNEFAFHYKNYLSSPSSTSVSPSSTDVAQYVKYDYDNIVLQSDKSYTEEGIVLNGVDDYVCVGLGNHNFSSSLTMAIRLKFPTIPTGNKVIISNYEDGGFQLLLSDGKLRIMAFNRGSSSVTSEDFKADNFTVAANTWYTIAVVVNTGGIHIFVDGVKVANITKTMNLTNSMHPVFIGANPNPGSYSAMANIIVSNFAFINQAVDSSVISQYFSGEINPSLARANCFLNFVGFEHRTYKSYIHDDMITGHYVWVPRFQIKSTLQSGEVDIEIVPTNMAAHDAFRNEGLHPISGFWFAKFENSLDYAGNVRAVANAESITTLNLGQMESTVETQIGRDAYLVRNSQWAAVAYFAQSRYGLSRTGEYIEMQGNSTNITGYNYKTNVAQSTTQNVYGIYDMAGGLDEYVMANYRGYLGSAGFSSSAPMAYIDGDFDESVIENYPTGPDSLEDDVVVNYANYDMTYFYYNIYDTYQDYLSAGIYHAMGECESYPPSADSVFVSESNPWLVRTGLFDFKAATGAAGYTTRTFIIVS